MFSKREVRRQATHATLGVVLSLLLLFNIADARFMFGLLLLSIVLSIMKKRRMRIPFFDWFLALMQRKSEQETIPAKGLIFYLLGSFFAVLLFPNDIAIASILILAFGDSISRLFGPRGNIKHPFNSNKFIEGIILGAIFASIAASIFVPLVPAVIAASTAMFIEGLDIEVNNFKVDDNLTIPIVAGFILLLLV